MENIEERPNRTAFAGKFKSRHNDVDFEDKETRYGALSEDYDRLGRYEESGKALSGVFEKHRWIASMFEALRKNSDLDPISWMADNGIDITEALSDDTYRKGIADRIAAWQKSQVDGAAKSKETEENLNRSAEALASLGLSTEENTKMWNYFFEEVVAPVLAGEVSTETWKMVQKAMNYDTDIASASEQSAMKARNEKIRNRTQQAPEEIPPTLSQGGEARNTGGKKGKGFFSDLV